jgi:hypothetical protein
MCAERDHLKIVWHVLYWYPTCMYCLVNKGQTSDMSKNVFFYFIFFSLEGKNMLLYWICDCTFSNLGEKSMLFTDCFTMWIWTSAWLNLGGQKIWSEIFMHCFEHNFDGGH